ncbi:hypothetical protein XELAEV_18034988mg [Xenopus laevis]|uniref:Uncharacterized protein n=1 Tax=Xenopus laevis TaxID=8355 RepID=A0A974CEV5_XENLA|nr:hypothetical protein XELAEV_18034988mg [Xenopus laevis]
MLDDAAHRIRALWRALDDDYLPAHRILLRSGFLFPVRHSHEAATRDVLSYWKLLLTCCILPPCPSP